MLSPCLMRCCLFAALLVLRTTEGKQDAKAPNIILVLLDDLDLTLGGLHPLQKTSELIADAGASANNWFIHTPVCCPSRAELLTGRYFHSLKTNGPADKGCMHINMDYFDKGTQYLFAPYLEKAGYTVGLFGKYLNSGVPLDAPDGISKWLANGGGNYYNPEFNYDGTATHFDNNTFSGYSTSIIGNISTAWIKEVASGEQPFMAYIAPKAPHIEDGNGFPKTQPAPWYTEAFPGIKAPRTENYNKTYADHHWMIAQQPPMTVEQGEESDELYRTRWQSLLSVEDLVQAVVEELEAANVLNETYILFTSDHGFRFGQFRMPEGKWNMYENDIHIPFLIRGPGITPGSTFDFAGTNVDVMPTILGLAGVATPDTMEGRSLTPFIVNEAEAMPVTAAHIQTERAFNSAEWRKGVLIEYYGLGDVVRYEHLEDTYNNTFRAFRMTDGGNYVLAEFTDLRTNYNFTTPGYMFEMYDITSDPYQTTNIYETADPGLKKEMYASLVEAYACDGRNCP